MGGGRGSPGRRLSCARGLGGLVAWWLGWCVDGWLVAGMVSWVVEVVRRSVGGVLSVCGHGESGRGDGASVGLWGSFGVWLVLVFCVSRPVCPVLCVPSRAVFISVNSFESVVI